MGRGLDGSDGRDERPRRRRRRPTRGAFVYEENYAVVYAASVADLEAKVKGYLDDGWKTAGGVAAMATGGPTLTGAYFYQAVVLPAEGPDE